MTIKIDVCIKSAIVSLYSLLIVCMGTATVIEKIHGTSVAADWIYGSWWFAVLWAVVALLTLCVLVRTGVWRRMAVMLLHVSFGVILIGALVTRLTAESGTVHLRSGDAVSVFTGSDGVRHDMPFTMSLETFSIHHYPGTDAVMDYQADIRVCSEGETSRLSVSMNNIGKVAGYRFYQSSYDSDMAGTVLLVAHDPYGIAITYTGYALLFLSLLWTLCSRRTHIRRLYRMAVKPVAAAAMLIMLIMMPLSSHARPQLTAVDKGVADDFGEVAALWNGRICPLNTVAAEFVTKLCGRASWEGHSANEIFMGWMIYYTEWEQQPIIKVKSDAVQRMLGIEGQWACVRDFYSDGNRYKLEGKANDMALAEPVRKAVREADEKLQVVTMFYNSEMLRIFPLADKGRLAWHTPGSTELPAGVAAPEFQFINHAMDYLVMAVIAGDGVKARDIIARLKLYQKDKAGAVMPSPGVVRMEILYNRLHSMRWTVFMFLALSVAFCLLSFRDGQSVMLRRLHTAAVIAQAAAVTAMLALRWIVSGHVPLSNGFETMLFMSWAAVVTALAVMRRMAIVKSLGPVVSSLCLLVAMMATGSPQVTQLMPVLQSPLLSVHVAMVMTAYALFALITLIAVRCLLMCGGQRGGEEALRLAALSRLLLYPAVALLAMGIFIGAVWANVSWGTYWSWDPKETWALITLMVYAVPLHRASAFSRHAGCPSQTGRSEETTDSDGVDDSVEYPQWSASRGYHLYVLLAFLAILMTYFGVNFFLSGMHSYA